MLCRSTHSSTWIKRSSESSCVCCSARCALAHKSGKCSRGRSSTERWVGEAVGEAAMDLIDQFRAQVDAEEGRVAQLLAFDADQHRKAPQGLGK